MSNKKLVKFLKEIEKLDIKNLNHVSSLNKFQFDVLLFLQKNNKCSVGLIVKKIKKIENSGITFLSMPTSIRHVLTNEISNQYKFRIGI